jgi:hypothetical protein
MNASSACLPQRARKQEQQDENQTSTVVPQRNEEEALKWVRWECYKRYHAVYVEALGVYWTYCGLSRRPAGVFDETTTPPARCQHCRSRIRYAFLVPDSLRALRNQAFNDLPG